MARLTDDAASMRHDDLLREGQSETRASLLGRIKQVEHVLAVLFADTCAFVVDLDANSIVVAHGFELCDSTVRHRLSRISQQVQQRLTKLCLVHRNRRKLRRKVHLKLYVRRIHFPADELREIAQ
jgi:hypothetical protein